MLSQPLSLRSTSQAFTSGGALRSISHVRIEHKSSRAVQALVSRREMLQQSLTLPSMVLGTTLLNLSASQSAEESKMLCDQTCTASLEVAELVTTGSGLQYKDLVLGKGPSPRVGFQVVANYVAMTPKLRVFDSSLDRGAPYDIRIGTGQVVAGLDEGIMTMKPGGIRRLYIPGDLAFPKGLKSAAGRPAVPPKSAVVFDVQLLYIPGLEEEEEE